MFKDQKSINQLLMIASGLAMLVTVAIGIINGSLGQLLAGELTGSAVIFFVASTTASASALIIAFSAAIRPESQQIYRTVAGCAIAFLVTIESSHALSSIPNSVHFTINCVCLGLFVYCYLRVITGMFRLQGSWVTHPPWIATILFGLYGFAGFLSQNFTPLSFFINSMPLLRSCLILGVPVAILVITALYKPLRLNGSSILKSILLRLPDPDSDKPAFKTLIFCFAGAILDLVAATIIHAFYPDAVSISQFAFCWMGFVSVAIMELNQYNREQKQGIATQQLATHSARRFLKRNLSEQQAWAATLGLKTTSFQIDHDPNGSLLGKLPASIMQIRAEEIQRCVIDILGPMYMHNNVFGQRIFGAIDPEISLRSCVDALKLFATLYLDAGPLVERRIKGLAALLPIVDPGLADVLRNMDLEALIRRNLWFFYFDFGWIDQHIVRTKNATRYDVRIGLLSSQIRHSMFEYLEKTGGFGNYVWLGPQARERLIQEAPMLKHIIEACPVASTYPGDEQLMFIIKFEQLIPRLQRYFDLDSMRKAILDFEPNPENARLLNFLGIQVSKARTPEEILEVVNAITSYPWRGFKEKDWALQLIQQAYQALSQKVGNGHALHDSKNESHKILYEKTLDAVRKVGYPSQILHAAQQKKIALRDLAKLCEAAKNPRDMRFHEAWLMMSVTDFSRYEPAQRWLLFDFLSEITEEEALIKQPLVQIKAIDAVASLGRTLHHQEIPLLTDVINRFGQSLAERDVDPDICCLLLDVYDFLASTREDKLDLSSITMDRFDRYVQRLQASIGTTSPKFVAVASRWQEIRHKHQAFLKSSEAA